MLEAVKCEPTSRAPTSWGEIKERYPDQWVTLVDTDWIDDRSFEFRTTRVIGHGQSRAEAIAQAEPLLAGYDDFGCFYTGRIRAYR